MEKATAISIAALKLGNSCLRAKQREAVLNFIDGKDVFVSMAMPTGSGKSLCYYILPVAFDLLRNNSKPKCIAILNKLPSCKKSNMTH